VYANRNPQRSFMKIYYTPDFRENFKKLDLKFKKIVLLKIEFFKKDPLHPSLRMHPLKGKLSGFWSISINQNYRIILKRKSNGDIVFYSIGKHDVYRNYL